MSKRERDQDRERERGSRGQAAQARTNEYFVPRDGIDREVITADICRYLGNDALVRPGNYQNPDTRQVQAGYFITAYRNLTTAMIADLKADSDRWETERRAATSRGLSQSVDYRGSTTHQSRQYYGPTEAAPGPPSGPYPSQAAPVQAQVYDNGQNYSQGYGQPAAYGAPQGYGQQENYYVAGSDYRVAAEQPLPRAPAPQSGAIPRTQYATNPTPGGYQQTDARSNYYPTPVSSGAPVQGYNTQQPSDPFYGRAGPGTYGGDSPSGDYERPYDETVYSQVPSSSASNSQATVETHRRVRDTRDGRESHRHRDRR